jgi:hypothetical protein
MWILHVVALPVSARQPHIVGGGMDGYLTYGVRHRLPATRALSVLSRKETPSPLKYASGSGERKRLYHQHLVGRGGTPAGSSTVRLPP